MISVVIPSYKNREQLRKNLENNLPYLKNCEIVIVNDDPSTSIQQDLEEFKDIVLIENSKNLGFGGSVNTGVRASHGKYVMLLNSDVLLHDQSYKKAFSHFGDSNVFAVGFAQKEKNGTIVGKNSMYWDKGIFQHKKAVNHKFGITAWAEGGSCIIDKRKFEEIGRFDLLYAPFFWEDIDISYRAWKKGFKVFFDPAILVTHHHGSTIGKYFTGGRVKIVSYRNQFIFVWKNITSPGFTKNHLFRLFPLLITFILQGEWEALVGFFWALIRLPQILTKRRSGKISQKISDEEILKHFE